MANILIVDDNQSLRASYASYLEQTGHHVDTTSSVDEALTYLASNTPNLILLDMLLPKKNGLELLQQYDILRTHPDVKVVAFSSLSELMIKEEAENLGVRVYLNKATMTPTDLANTITAVLSGP